jgi:DNA-binding transcriptional MerR regulator
MRGFTTSQVVKATRVNRKTLGYWHTSGFLSPSLQQSKGPGTRRLYSFLDLIAIKVTRELRQAGISLQGLRRVVKFLRKQKQLEDHPLAGAFLVSDGRDVFVQDGDLPMSALRQPGQGLLFCVVDLSKAVDEVREVVLAFGHGGGEGTAKAVQAG